MPYDLALFEQLNAEYRGKPLVSRPRSYKPSDIRASGRRRAGTLAKRFNLAGKSILEIGCGRGEVLAGFAREAGCR